MRLAQQGVDALLEAVLLQSEVLELRATRSGLASGVVIESSVEKGRGAVATVLVKKGTLKLGDPIIAGTEFGRVRALFDEDGKSIELKLADLKAGRVYEITADVPAAADGSALATSLASPVARRDKDA